jgi:DNA polymerase-3 subunit gamma/tau
MRDLLGTIHLGRAGNRKVYILDEVHQLTKEAASAVLKVLEEPPAHVVWVLATTDPQKVPATIRSRTQHFEFGLLAPEALEKHVRWVADDAGLEVDDDAIAYVVREAKGSLRDALSTLERVAAAGGSAPLAVSVGEVIDALAAHDVGAVLGAVARLVDAGRDPRQLTSDLVADIRDAFLMRVAPDLVRRPEGDRAALERRSEALGAALAVRAMETLGETLVALRDAPDARVLVEAALVKLARPDADPSPGALADRISRLERLVGDERATPAPRAPGGSAARSAGGPQSTPRSAASAGSALPPAPRAPRRSERPPPDEGPADSAVPAATPVDTGPPPPPQPEAAGMPSRDELTMVWGDELLDQVPRKIRARFSTGRFREIAEGVAVFVLPNEPSLARAAEVQGEVEEILQRRFGRPVPLRLVTEGGDGGSAAAGAGGPTAPAAPDDEVVDLAELEDAPGGLASGLDALTEAFPGAEVTDADKE